MATPKPRTSRSQKPICHLRIGFTDLLIDADKGLQVIKLLSESTECDVSYDHGYSYVITEPPKLSMAMVNANSVKRRDPVDRQLAIGHDPD